jgi:hypothetical protein
MLPTGFDTFPADSPRAGRVALEILALDERSRGMLAGWREELRRLIARRKESPARTVNAALRTQFVSAIAEASRAIREVCAPEKSRIIAEAAETIRPYFQHAGDARAAAMRFPAVVEMGEFLSGPSLAETLNGLAGQAEAVSGLIGRILDGGEIYHFSGPKA